jgi:hypothetical protein
MSPDRPWGPPSLLSNGYRRLFPRGESGRAVKLTTQRPTSAEVKKTWVYASTPLHTSPWLSAEVVKHDDNFHWIYKQCVEMKSSMFIAQRTIMWYCSANWLVGLHLNIPVNRRECFRVIDFWATLYIDQKKLNSVAVVPKRTIPTERPPLFGEVSANLCG